MAHAVAKILALCVGMPNKFRDRVVEEKERVVYYSVKQSGDTIG